MNLVYQKASAGDLTLLTEIRVQVLRAVNHLPGSADMSEVRQHTKRYYQAALPSGEHIAYLVYDGARFAATGGVSFFQVMPTFHNPTGRKAYIMNIYTHPAYRRQGIAFRTLDLLVRDCLAQGVDFISLEATDMGRPLYERYGFTAMKDEMILPEPKIIQLQDQLSPSN